VREHWRCALVRFLKNLVFVAAFVWLVPLIFLLDRSHAQPVPDTDDAKSVIAYLTASSRTHGLVERYLDDATKRLVEDVMQRPAHYVNAVKDSLGLPSGSDVATWEREGRRLGNTMYLIQLMGPQQAGGMARDFFDRVTSEIATHEGGDRVDDRPNGLDALTASVRVLLDLQKGSLGVLAEFRDPHAVDYCVRTVERERRYMRGTWVEMLNYLELVGPFQPDIRPRLEDMYNSPDSPLRNHPQLLRVLQAMDKNKADRRIEDRNTRKKGDESGDE